ncbi:mucin-5AC isoform X1 [Hydra vulgaris]|uniref:mucin-5AC isoform X1 n=1 Tax=Hydra vulgaris TaxID=6087 RepID=UPI001F5F1CE2|nr:mucin-5AC [Hydra vulgaris]XP_047146373.1 mucin-5AC [Hydra vulgaris]
MLRSMINYGFSFIIMANQLSCFFIDRSLYGDFIIGNSTICSGPMFCLCPNSTFLSYNYSSLHCGNSLEGCSLKVEGSSTGIHTLYGMSSYNLTIISNQNDSVCKTEPIVEPIFTQDYQNSMKFLPDFSPYLKQGFFASIINTTKVQLKVMLHLNGLLLKLFINCDGKEQCVAIKFEGQSEYPMTESSIANATGFTTPIPVTTTTKTTTTATTGPSTTVLTTISITTSGLNSTMLATTTTTNTSLPNTSESTTSARSNLSTNLISTLSPNTTTSIITDIPLNNGSFSTNISTSSPNTTTNVKTDTPLNNGSFSTVSSSNFTTTIITTQNESAFTNATTVVTISTESSETLTTTVITTNNKSNGTTNLPAKSDAIVGKTSYIGQIIVGIAAFLVLLVIVLILVLAYKKRKEKSFFRIPPTTPAALDSIEGPQNNHASIIRMESNSLSTLPSTLNNFQVKSNPLYDNYYEQPTQNMEGESPTTAKETPVYQTVKPDLHNSYNNPTFELDIEKKQKKKRVLFAPLPPPPPPPPQENDYTESDEKNLIDFPSNNFIKNDTEKQFQGSSRYDYNRAITEI